MSRHWTYVNMYIYIYVYIYIHYIHNYEFCVYFHEYPWKIWATNLNLYSHISLVWDKSWWIVSSLKETQSIYIATYIIKYNHVLYTVYTYWGKTDENTCWCSHHCRRGRDVGLRPAPRALGRLGPAKKRSPGLEMKRTGDFISSLGMGQN